jgi:hypothetical protein
MAYYEHGYGYDARTYGVGNLSPLLGMGSQIAGFMGHSNLAKMLGQANGLMGNVSKYFPNGLGALQSGGFGGGFPGGFGGSLNPGQQMGFGGQGLPFGRPPFSGFGMPFGMPGTGSGLGGFSQPYPGFQGGGFGHLLPSMFGSPGYGGSMPGYF